MSSVPGEERRLVESLSRQFEPGAEVANDSDLLRTLNESPGNQEEWISQVLADELLRQRQLQRSTGLPNRTESHPKSPPKPARRRNWLVTIALSLGVGCGSMLALFVTVALLLPAVQTARDSGRRGRAQADLETIGHALLAYAEEHGSFPPAYTVDAMGRPLHSWRVLILPHLGEKALYDRFRLDEPWDTKHNRSLVDRMPEVYRLAGDGDGEEQSTTYVAIPVEDGALPPAKTPYDASRAPLGVPMNDFRDGLSNTVLLVSVDEELAVGWTKPIDYPVGTSQVEQQGALADELRSQWQDEGRIQCRLALFADGTVRVVEDGVGAASVTRFGGEPPEFER